MARGLLGELGTIVDQLDEVITRARTMLERTGPRTRSVYQYGFVRRLTHARNVVAAVVHTVKGEIPRRRNPSKKRR